MSIQSEVDKFTEGSIVERLSRWEKQFSGPQGQSVGSQMIGKAKQKLLQDAQEEIERLRGELAAEQASAGQVHSDMQRTIDELRAKCELLSALRRELKLLRQYVTDAKDAEYGRDNLLAMLDTFINYLARI